MTYKIAASQGAKRYFRGNITPTEIANVDKFVEVSERAEYCAVKKLEKVVKLKLRTPRRLYTLKAKPLKADEIIKKLKCKIMEV